MSVAETYDVLFAAIAAADFLILVWLLVTIALNLFVFFCSDRLSQSMNTVLQVLYTLFALFILGRWGIIASKVTDFLDSLRMEGESLPPQAISMVFGLLGLLFLLAFSLITIFYLRSRLRRTRVI